MRNAESFIHGGQLYTAGPMTTTPTGHGRSRIDPLPLVAVSVLLTSIVLVGLFPRLWYGLHDISDIPLYHHYAARMAAGEMPFSGDFLVEYPPLALPLFRLPGHVDDLEDYIAAFAMWMGLIALLTAALTSLTAHSLWPSGRNAWVAGLLFPAGLALTGAIVVNRYDIAVAAMLAGFLLCLVRRWHLTAAVILGLGFALKLTPAILLPLLIIASHPRGWPKLLLAFTLAAAVPFLPFLAAGADSILHVFRYHMERPLQIESVLGTPMLLGQLFGADWASHANSHGSQSLIAPGAEFAAASAGFLTLLALAGAYGLAWRRRAVIAASDEAGVLAAMLLILTLMCTSKVLSPQFFIWLLPAWALVSARDPVLGILGGNALLLTQIEFPALYWRFVDMEPGPVAVVVARNLVLAAMLALAAWRLWRLPADTDRRSPSATSASATRPAASSHSVQGGER